MELTEIIGIAFLAFALLIATGQMAFAYGRHIEAQAQRAAADKRVQGVLQSVNKSRPSRRLTYRKVDAKTVGKRRYLNSKLVGEVVA
jgi:hypothetical protein